MENLLEKYGFTKSEQLALGIKLYTYEDIKNKPTNCVKAATIGVFSGGGPCVCNINFGELMCANVD